MPEFTATESAFMERAIQLAQKGLFTAHPNPVVGCVLVKDGAIVGEGWHAVAGEAHAEIHALQDAGDAAKGATAYVTLEPCSHHGKTPPCSDALIRAGIGEVIVACEDPNPKVDGRGMKALADAGITVRSGLLDRQVSELLAGFLCRINKGRPRVRLKIACSIDGRIAMSNGQSQWITGPEAREDVQRGIGTVLADDPSLTVRDAALNPHGKQPIRAILDSELRMPLAAKMLTLPGETLVFCCNDEKAPGLIEAGASVVKLDGEGTLVDLPAVLQELAQRSVNDLLVEAGPGVAGALLEQHLVDEFIIYQAPHIMGSETMGMFATPNWTDLADRQGLLITDTEQVGNDVRITAKPVV